MTETNQLAESTPLPIQSVADITTIGAAIAQSGMFGSCTAGKGAVIATICHQRGIDLLDFKMSYHVTDQGDVTMRSDKMLAEFQKRGGKCKWEQFDPKEARAVWSYGENEDLIMAYTIEDAKEAGLIKPGSAYEKHPADMLRARLISKSIRMICPEAIAGVYTPEEIEESRPPRPAPGTAPTRAKPIQAVVSDSPAVSVDAEHYVDCTTCPVPGKLHGIEWGQMDLDTLRAALNLTNDEMTPGHFKAVEFALQSAEDEAGA